MIKALITTLIIPIAAAGQIGRITGEIVQIDGAGNTIPSRSIATPQQVESVQERSGELEQQYTLLAERVEQCEQGLTMLSTHRIVHSTVYVQSIGGVPHDPDKQTVTLKNLTLTETTIEITAEVDQLPLVPLKLDWRLQIQHGEWQEIPSEVIQLPAPAPPSTAAAAFKFTLPRPAGITGFYRVVDNSSGVSGSGLYWLVFGSIIVNGHMGYTGMLGPHHFQGGILTEPIPLGGL